MRLRIRCARRCDSKGCPNGFMPRRPEGLSANPGTGSAGMPPVGRAFIHWFPSCLNLKFLQLAGYVGIVAVPTVHI